jgi:hypothetical protein
MPNSYTYSQEILHFWKPVGSAPCSHEFAAAEPSTGLFVFSHMKTVLIASPYFFKVYLIWGHAVA